MDRIDAMKVFVATLDEGSLAAGGRRLGKSPAAVSRAIAFLEDHVGTALLYRTTRSIRLSEAGERYAAACRRVLAELDEADTIAAGERAAPRGLLSLTAPVATAEVILQPILDDFLRAYPEVSVRLLYLDRSVNLIDEGMDVALRIAELADSSLIAVKVGEVRRVLVASSDYLDNAPPVSEPADLVHHQIVAMTQFGLESWSFPPPPGSTIHRSVQFTPRIAVNSTRAAMAAVVAGHGISRLTTHHFGRELADGRLRIVLADYEYAPWPVQLVVPEGRLASPKVRAFVDFAVPRLRRAFEALG